MSNDSCKVIMGRNIIMSLGLTLDFKNGKLLWDELELSLEGTPPFSNFTSSRVPFWRLMIEEFGPKIQYIKGSNNVVADALSYLPCSTSCSDEELFAALQYDLFDYFPVSFAIISRYQLKDKELQSS
jgi:hypothetical protein